MEKSRKGLTRRDFIKGAAGAVLAGAAGSASSCACNQETKTKEQAKTDEAPGETAPELRSKVVLVRDENVLGENRALNADVLVRMLDDGVMALLGESDAAAAWARLLDPSDTLGIKSNVWRFLRTPVVLEQAIKQHALDVGIPEERIGIGDRRVLSDPVFQKATALINARPLRTHHWSGVGSLIKNYVMFSPRPSSWHDDSCADLAGLWDLPEVKGKTRLNILVMLTPLFHGKGPHHFQAEYTWEYKGLIIATDPVAADATGVRIMAARRKIHFGEDMPFSTSPKHIDVAEKKFALGVADPSRIDVVKLGWKEDILI